MPIPLIITENDIQPLLTDPALIDGAIDACERATLAEYDGRVRSIDVVDRTTHEKPNLLQIHLATDDDFVTGFQVFGATPGQPRTNSRFVVLLDAETRQLLGIVPYEGLSPLRVGASAGVAARYLAPEGARTVGMLGSSKQARRQLQAIVRTVPGIESARVYSPTPENRERFAAETSAWLGIKVQAVEQPREAVEGADIVDSSTNTRTPAFEWEWVKAGALVMPIGGGQLPEQAIGSARIVVPTFDSTKEEATARDPLGAAIRDGRLKQEDVIELGAVVRSEATVRQTDSDTVVFDVGRINIWAVAVTHWAYEWCREREIGTPINLSATP
jgi:ornithine cyclodeaminase/alanine dehydrogenase-like protein (mu-crystallin family)